MHRNQVCSNYYSLCGFDISSILRAHGTNIYPWLCVLTGLQHTRRRLPPVHCCPYARTPVHFVRLQWKWFNAKYDPKSRPLSYGCRRRALVYIHMYHTYIPCIRPGIDYDGARGNLNKSVCIVESFVCAYTHIDVICPPLRLYKFTFNTVRSVYECIAPGERRRHVVLCATLGALLVHTRAFC